LALLTEKSIYRYLGKLLVIEPFTAESVTGVGYDLTVGLLAHVNPAQKKILEVMTFEEHVPRIVLKPNTYAIVISREHVFLSKRLAGTFHSKSTLASQAVYLNSTTCDPNWKGRLIFSLYNASGTEVPLDLDTTFTTMCIHEVNRPSYLRPKESKAVIERYLQGLGNHPEIVGFVMRDDEIKQTFETKVDRARRWAALPIWALTFCITAGSLLRLCRKYWVAVTLTAAALVCVAVLFTPDMPLSDRVRAAVTAAGAISGMLAFITAYLRAAKP
jgi:deoxycytidine triphosphate deaminase